MDEMEKNEDIQQKSEEMHKTAEELKNKVTDIQEKLSQHINMAMKSAADNLDITADKMHEASNFFRDRNVDTLRDDVSGFIKRYPTQTLAGALIFGFLFGKVLSR